MEKILSKLALDIFKARYSADLATLSVEQIYTNYMDIYRGLMSCHRKATKEAEERRSDLAIQEFMKSQLLEP